MPEQDVLMVYTTFPNEQSARLIARELVNRKLAACANIFGSMTSIFEWKGELMEEREVGVLFKTVRPRFAEFSSKLCKYHPYETPAVVGLDAAYVEKNYLTWLGTQTRQVD
ncbi:MAG: divalent-cation tolerance protein CutA [bacterium]|nr:divalent-cation tolerance protein CutA [bacterium]